MLEALSYSSCSVLKSITSSIRQWLIPSSWEARGQLNVTSAVMLQPPSSQASLPKCSYYSYSLLKRHRFQKILDQTNWLLLLPLVLMTVDESFLFWDLKICEFSPCSGWSFSIWWCEVEPLERTGKKSSSLALSNHFGWQSGREHSLLTGSDINIQGWIDSMQDISLLGMVKLRHDFFSSFLLLCEGMEGVQTQISFLPQNKLLEDKWSWAARSWWYCFPLGFKFCEQS